MSLGQTASAPASAWLTAVRASSSSASSLSTPSLVAPTPQWPCDVYSQRQTSVSSTQLRERGRSSRSARWMTPSGSQAPEPSSSFESGIPNRISAVMPASATASASRTRSATEKRPSAGSPSFGARVRPDEERHDEIAPVDARLAHEVAERAGAPEPAQPRLRERRHAGHCRSVR